MLATCFFPTRTTIVLLTWPLSFLLFISFSDSFSFFHLFGELPPSFFLLFLRTSTPCHGMGAHCSAVERHRARLRREKPTYASMPLVRQRTINVPLTSSSSHPPSKQGAPPSLPPFDACVRQHTKPGLCKTRSGYFSFRCTYYCLQK